MANQKVALIILDGWGLNKENQDISAVEQGQTPFYDALLQQYPTSYLDASGMAVGLPESQMGNSEVGHMNLGAGRVVYQNLVKVSKAVEEKTLGQNEELRKATEYAKAHDKTVHLMGLVSDGGVHSHIHHLKGLLTHFAEAGHHKVCVHGFTDGRDTDPKSGVGFLQDLQAHMQQSTGQLASVVGRYYAMDRDKRWERTKKAYDLMVKGEGQTTQNPLQALRDSYQAGVTDEFVEPLSVRDDSGRPVGLIDEGDVVLCFNFRTDRGRQITEALTQKNFPEQDMKTLDLYYLTMTNYDDTYQGVHVLYGSQNIPNTLGEVLAKAGKKQIRIAETEKYPHVTFFFSGGREEEFEGEKRIMIPSPKVATYDLQPEMSAKELADAIIPELEKEESDFVCLNFANPDMVGHTGDFEAVKKAVETVDAQNQRVVEAALQHGYACLIISDHGNSEYMQNPDGSPHTAHTTNLVPFIVAEQQQTVGKLNPGKLGDIAPTILHLMGIDPPAEMDGSNLAERTETVTA